MALVAQGDSDLRRLDSAAQLASVDLDRGGTREIRRQNVLDLDLDVVAHLHKTSADLLGNTRIDLQPLAFVVNARPAGRVLRPVAVVERERAWQRIQGIRSRIRDLKPDPTRSDQETEEEISEIVKESRRKKRKHG